MVVLTKSLERYFKETLGLSVTPSKWGGAGRLPFFMQDRYAFFQANLFDKPCLLMADQGREEQTPATISKNLLLVQEKWGEAVIYVNQSVSAYNRKRLIEHKVPFIVPGNQMYLPMLGIDLREHFKKLRGKSILFSPSTQVLVLYELLRGTGQVYTPSRLAPILGYTAMTLTRAFDELKLAELGEVAMEGRERVLCFKEKGQKLWEKTRNFLKSPVKKRVWIEKLRDDWRGVLAGLTALDHYTLLAAPQRPVYAISQEDWKVIRQRGDVAELPVPEPDTYEVEIWSYPPRMFAENDVVDRLSLYLSLQKNADERVETALEKMIEETLNGKRSRTF